MRPFYDGGLEIAAGLAWATTQLQIAPPLADIPTLPSTFHSALERCPMSRIRLLPALLLVVAASSSTIGQEDLLSELYGLGVHSYNSGDYRDAYENLSAAVEGGTKDPRAFYFRGLALAQLGRPEDARLDFAKGAQLEVAGGGDRYPIGRALERIQGTQRLTIERVRQVEKIKFQQAQLAESKRRFEDQKNIQAQEPVLTSKTPADVPPPAEMIDKGVTPPAEGDPFADDGLGTGAAEPAPVPSNCSRWRRACR